MNKSEWLVDGGLVYRLKDGENCDEINISQRNGARDVEHRNEAAVYLAQLLNEFTKGDMKSTSILW